MTEPKRGPGRPAFDPAVKKVQQNISIDPADLKTLRSINPNISQAIRQLIKERKETTHHG